MSGFIAVGHFLVTLLFSLILFLLWARVFLRYFKISSLHPISQTINTFLDPFIKPIANRIQTKNKKHSPYDWACFALIVIVEFVKYIILGFLLYKTMLPLSYLILFVITDLVVQPCNLLFYMLLIRVIMSWVKPDWRHPLEEVIRKITNPILAFGRSIVPDISGFDFSPFIILILLKVITLFMTASLPLRLV
ncbi:MAG: YggT family protein [Tatlockia sp.]|nr:YggT family protein [Tatlockia sp.]